MKIDNAPKGPEHWRIRLEPVTPETIAGVALDVGDVVQAEAPGIVYVLEYRRRCLFWKYWARATSSLDRRDAGAWAVFFRTPFPSQEEERQALAGSR